MHNHHRNHHSFPRTHIHSRASQLMNKTPFSREEQMRVVCAAVSYCPESWAAPGDKQTAAAILRAVQGGEGEEDEGSVMAPGGGGKRKDGEEEEGDGEGGQGNGGKYGSAWTALAMHLPTRTDAQCR